MTVSVSFDPKTHWETVYTNKVADAMSWYQDQPELSLEFIARAANDTAATIIDVGSGATTLIGALLDGGYQAITALDISETALNVARSQLGERAVQVRWVAADVRHVPPPPYRYDIWHDRAVLHFLTDPADRVAYVQTLRRVVKPGGQVIIAAFAPEGPQQCSNLDVVRYSPESLAELLGEGFTLLETLSETHTTPAQRQQQFTWCRFRVSGADERLDAGETACGDLIMLIFQRMKTFQPGQILEVYAHDPGAPIDIPAWCRQTGNSLVHHILPDEKGLPMKFYIQKKED